MMSAGMGLTAVTEADGRIIENESVKISVFRALSVQLSSTQQKRYRNALRMIFGL